MLHDLSGMNIPPHTLEGLSALSRSLQVMTQSLDSPLDDNFLRGDTYRLFLKLPWHQQEKLASSVRVSVDTIKLVMERIDRCLL